MAYIYYIWSSKSEKGGYIGLDRNPYNSYATSRIAAHIHNITTSPDAASKFILREGISNVFYGIWDESQNFGIDQSVYDHFAKAGWVASSKLQTAEVFHILYDMYYKLQRADANIVIGGQSRGCTIIWNPGNYNQKIKPDPVSIHLGDKKEKWDVVKNKLFFPEQYGVMHKITKQYMKEFLTDTSLWVKVITSNLNNIPYTQSNLEKDFNNFLKSKKDNSFSWNKYGIQAPNIDFNKFYNQFMTWFKQSLGGNLQILTKMKKIPSKVFIIKAVDYGMFTPIINIVPQWYSALMQTQIKVPKDHTPNNQVLVEIVQKATARVFKNIFDRTPKLANYNTPPGKKKWLKSRVEAQMKRYGFNIDRFYNWDLTYRCFATLWLEYYQRMPLIPTNMFTYEDRQAFYSYQQPYPPNYYYVFSQKIVDVVTTVRKPQDIPFYLL